MKTNIDYRDSVLQDVPTSYRLWFEEERKYLQEKVSPNAKVLEVGCGNGRSIADILPITKDITGIDHDDKAVSDTKNIFPEYPSVKILKADALDMPFENESFDSVLSLCTFVNFAEKKLAILEEMKRVLKKTGTIIISVYSEDSLEERLLIYEKIGMKIKKVVNGMVFFEEFDENLGAKISEQFTKIQLEEIFGKANLQIEDIQKKGIAYLCTVSK